MPFHLWRTQSLTDSYLRVSYKSIYTYEMANSPLGCAFAPASCRDGHRCERRSAKRGDRRRNSGATNRGPQRRVERLYGLVHDAAFGKAPVIGATMLFFTRYSSVAFLQPIQSK